MQLKYSEGKTKSKKKTKNRLKKYKKARSAPSNVSFFLPTGLFCSFESNANNKQAYNARYKATDVKLIIKHLETFSK